MKEMKMTLHIPAYENTSSYNVIKQLKQMLDICCSWQKTHEHWQLDLDIFNQKSVVYVKHKQCEEYWGEGWDTINEKEIAQAIASIHFRDPYSQKVRFVGGKAVLLPYAKYCRLPRENAERGYRCLFHLTCGNPWIKNPL